MKKIVIVIIIQFYLLTSVAYTQNNHNHYEQIGFDFFMEYIVVRELSHVKFFVYNGIIYPSNNGFIDCMHINGDDIGLYDERREIDLRNTYGVKVLKKLSFFKKLFTSKFRIKILHVFKSYVTKDEVVICILVYSESEYVYFNLKVNPQTNQVEDYCKTVMID